MLYFGLSGAKNGLRGLPPWSKRLAFFGSVQWCLNASYEIDFAIHEAIDMSFSRF